MKKTHSRFSVRPFRTGNPSKTLKAKTSVGRLIARVSVVSQGFQRLGNFLKQADSIRTSIQIKFDTSKSINEEMTTAENLGFAVSRPLETNFDVFDRTRIAFDKPLSENVLTDVALSVNFQKSIQENFTPSDSFSYEIETFLNFEKSVVENVKTTGFITFDFNKGPQDNVIKSDSGEILTQDYFSESYVEPGYAGSSTTF